MTRALAFATVTALPLLIVVAVQRPVDVRAPLPQGQSVQRVLPNDNRSPAGRMERDTLVLRLTVIPADWHILRRGSCKLAEHTDCASPISRSIAYRCS